jgi:hypothetical protein
MQRPLVSGGTADHQPLDRQVQIYARHRASIWCKTSQPPSSFPGFPA